MESQLYRLMLQRVVPEPSSEVAEDGEVLGPKHHHGGVRALRCYGASFVAAARDHSQECQGEQRVRGALAPR
ncbi:hypothetical protein C0J52_21556 [Blattella germanica]|nr:hypothetical protein C0J52_21556 [Blattella germanica]